MHAFLQRLGRGAARFHWFVIAGWLMVVVALFVLRAAFGGTYVNNYTVPGSGSSAGLNILNKDFAQAGGYSGSIVFHATSGTVAEHSDAVKTSMAAVGKLPDVVSAVDPLATSQQAYISKDGSIVNAPVSFSVVPASLDKSYVGKLDAAVQSARAAGLQVEYGGGAGQIGKQADDGPSEAIGLVLALLLLFLMFRSIVASGLPLVSAVFSVGGGLAILGLLAAVKDFPVSAPTVATLLGLGVAIDYGLFLVSRHREQLDAGTGPAQDSSRKAYDLIAKGFGPGANGPLTVVVQLPSGSSTDKQTLLSGLQSTLQKTEGVAAVQPPSTNSAGTTAIINVIPTTSPSAAQTQDLVNRIRDDVLPGQKEPTYVVGTTAGYVDFTEKVGSRMPRLIGAVVLLAFLLLTVAGRDRRVGADPVVRADADVRDRVRAVDGLRGVPAVPGARGVGRDPGQSPRGGDRDRRPRG